MIQHGHIRRADLEVCIEGLIALLDLLDGDPDFEDVGDENDVGMPEGWCLSARANGQDVILEDDEDGHDAEPEETDENGDELDCCHSEEEWSPYETCNGSLNRKRGEFWIASNDSFANVV